jgi:hypothetical protein
MHHFHDPLDLARARHEALILEAEQERCARAATPFRNPPPAQNVWRTKLLRRFGHWMIRSGHRLLTRAAATAHWPDELRPRPKERRWPSPSKSGERAQTTVPIHKDYW